MKRYWLLLSALLLTACGPLPITIDLLPTLKKYGYDQHTFSRTVAVAPGTTLQDQNLKLPDDNGAEFTFDAPSLPAYPTNLALDYEAMLSYALSCAENLGGDVEAQVYLAEDTASLWQSPLEGAGAHTSLQSHGTLRLRGQARLSQAQLDAVLSGHLVLGIAVKTKELSGQASNDPACLQDGKTQVRFSGSYEIERAAVEVRFF